MIREYMNGSLDSSVLEVDKTLVELPLSDAVYEFRKEYVVAVAQQTAKFDVYAMSRTLKYDRSELSKFVNEAAIKPQIIQLQQTYNPSEWYTKSPAAEVNDTITQEVITESIAENDFDIKKATNKYKKKYVTEKVSQYGIKKASEILEVDERTIRNHLNGIIREDLNLASRLN